MKSKILSVILAVILLFSALPAYAVVDCGDADDFTFSGSVYMSYPLSLYSQFPNGESPWRFQIMLHSTGELLDMTKYLNGWSYDVDPTASTCNFTYGNIGVSGHSFATGSKADPVLSFVCPYDGEILIPEATLTLSDKSNDGIKFKFTLNDYFIYPSDGWKTFTAGETVTFPETKLTVKAGDILRWQVNMGPKNTYNDDFHWYDLSVSYVSSSQNAVGLGNGVVSPFPSDMVYTDPLSSPTQYNAVGVNGTGNWYFQNCEIDTNNYLNLDRVGSNWFGGWYGNWKPGTASATGCHPGTGGDGVRTYVCPKDGLLAIPSATVTSDSTLSKDGIRFRILKNNTPVYPASGWVTVEPGASVTIPDLLFEVKEGDSIHFRVNCGSDQNADSTSWTPSVRYAQCDSYVSVSFTDITHHWAKDTIVDMYNEGILSGRTDSMFAPDEPVTRAEFFSMAIRAAQYAESDFDDTFADVHFSSWYARSIITAFKNNLIDYAMITGKNIEPDRNITREEAASVLVNTHKMKKRRAIAEDSLTGFSDASSITDWASAYMAQAVSLGLMQGNNGALNPTDDLTRAEAAQLFSTLLDLLEYEDPDGTLSKVYKDSEGAYLPVYQNTDLQALIMNAYNNGDSSVTIPKGVYRLDSQANGLGIYLNGLSDFTIYANDVVVSYKSAGNDLMRIENCSNVKIYGLTLDHEYASAYEGIIRAIDPNGMYFDVWMDPGHVPNMLNTRFVGPSFSTMMFLSGEDYSIIPNTSGRSIDGNIRKIGNDLYRVYVSKNSGNVNVKVGDIMAGRALSADNLTITSCSDLHFEDFTIYNGVNGIFESGAEECSTFENLNIVPGPKYELATLPRLRSINGTGYFVRGSRTGATINNSEISATNDDGINIHAAYDRVAAVESNNTFVVGLSGSTPEPRVGDEYRFTSTDGIIRGEGKITSLEKLSGYTPSSSFTDFSAGNGYYRIVLDQTISGTVFGDRACNLNTLSTGLTITNSRFVNNSPRAILTHAMDATVENCYFENVYRFAIEAAPELPTWNEGDYVRNFTVKGCTFVGNSRSTADIKAAIGIWGDDANGSRGNKNIQILNNTFTGQYSHDLLLSYVTGATVSGNTFNAAATDISNYGMAATASLNIFNADQVTLSDNTFTSSRTKVKTDYPVGSNGTITGLPQ